MHHRSRDLTDLRPAAAFWRGYRANFRGALVLWVPWLAWLTMVGVNLAHLSAAGVPGWWAVLLVVVAVAATLAMADALVITSLFAFRPVDVARLSASYLGRKPGVTLGNAVSWSWPSASRPQRPRRRSRWRVRCSRRRSFAPAAR
jgi:hypothetical protein